MRSIVWLGIPACVAPEYGVQRQDRVDVFVQERRRAVDLLLVVDNSRSMVEEQVHLARAFDTLIGALQGGDTDWRVAVTTPETSFSDWRASLEGALDEVIVEAADGTALDAVAWDDREWPVAPGVAFTRCAEGWAEAPATPDAAPACLAVAAGPDAGPRPPDPGDLVLSELAPVTPEPGCGWVELWNGSADTLDLSGVVLRDAGRDQVTVPDGALLAPNDTWVWTSWPGCGAADLVDDGLHLAAGERWVDADTPDGDRVFSELVTVGDGGFGLEQGLENAWLALAHPAHPETDAGFVRDEADLAIVFVSDEDDLSPDAVADYVNAFRSLKGVSGQRDPERVRLAVVAGLEAPEETGAPSCDSALGEAAWAPRYVSLAALSGGASWSICGDLDGIAEEVGLTVSEQRYAFQLSGVPALDTLDVGVYASVDDEAPLSRPARGEDYDLFVRPGDDGRQQVWMRFEDAATLPPGSVLVVSYETLPASATLDLTEAP